MIPSDTDQFIQPGYALFLCSTLRPRFFAMKVRSSPVRIASTSVLCSCAPVRSMIWKRIMRSSSDTLSYAPRTPSTVISHLTEFAMKHSSWAEWCSEASSSAFGTFVPANSIFGRSVIRSIPIRPAAFFAMVP